jgi:hypothetical protein
VLFIVEFGDRCEVRFCDALDGLQALGSEMLLLGSTELGEHSEGDIGGSRAVKLDEPLDRSAYPGMSDASAAE